MPNILTLTVENPDEVRNAGAYGSSALIRLQTSATEGGAYADVSGTGSTPTTAVLAATRAYTAYDPNGTVSSWYRTRYEDGAAARFSDWSDPFQTGGEDGGLICSLADVKQQIGGTLSANAEESLLDFIRAFTSQIENYCRRWFLPRPLSGTATYVFSPTMTESGTGRLLWMPRGVRTLTALGYATTDQPDTGGVYTSVTSTTWALHPPSGERDYGWPATAIRLLETTGDFIHDGINRMQATGSFGWAEPPPEVALIGAAATIRRYQARGTGVATALGTEDFGARLLRWISPEERETLEFYKDRSVH